MKSFIFTPTQQLIFLAQAMDEATRKYLYKMACRYSYQTMIDVFMSEGTTNLKEATTYSQIGHYYLDEKYNCKFSSFSAIPIIASIN